MDICLSIYVIIQLTIVTTNIMWIIWFIILFVIIYSMQVSISLLINMKINNNINKNYNLTLALQQIIWITIDKLDSNTSDEYNKIYKIATHALLENKTHDDI